LPPVTLCTKFDSNRDSASDPAGEFTVLPQSPEGPDPLAGLRGPYF